MMSIRYNCGCQYDLEAEAEVANGVIALNIALCLLHKTQLSPPQAELTV